MCYKFFLVHPCSEVETKSRARQRCAALEERLRPAQVSAAQAQAAALTLEDLARELLGPTGAAR